MAATCTVCGTKLGFGRRLTGKSLCELHEAEQRTRDAAEAAARAAAKAEYLVVAASAASDSTAAERLPALAAQARMTNAEMRQANVQAVTGLIASAIEDSYLTEVEEQTFLRGVSQLDLNEEDVQQAVSPYRNSFVIARLNAGRLPTISDPVIFLQRNEIAHAQVEASLLKEVVHRESRGGYSGFSIPIYAGVRYRVGSYRGRSVVVGTSLEVADKGILCLTSQRAVFKGMRRSVECLYSKLVGLNVFDDGIQFPCLQPEERNPVAGRRRTPRGSRYQRDDASWWSLPMTVAANPSTQR